MSSLWKENKINRVLQSREQVHLTSFTQQSVSSHIQQRSGHVPSDRCIIYHKPTKPTWSISAPTKAVRATSTRKTTSLWFQLNSEPKQCSSRYITWYASNIPTQHQFSSTLVQLKMFTFKLFFIPSHNIDYNSKFETNKRKWSDKTEKSKLDDKNASYFVYVETLLELLVYTNR